MLWDLSAVQFFLREYARPRCVVATAGVFDELTAEDVRFLRDARLQGDTLVVFVSTAGRRDVRDRATVLAGLRYVDFVVKCESLERELEMLQPDLWCSRTPDAFARNRPRSGGETKCDD